jgi:hypothetical protein
MDLNVAVRFQSSPATVGAGAGGCVEVGAVGGNEWLSQPVSTGTSVKTRIPARALMTSPDETF